MANWRDAFKMRKIFLLTSAFFLILTITGILLVGGQLYSIRKETEQVTEAQKSLIKRLELRDAIHELKDITAEGNISTSQLSAIKTKTGKIVKDCYRCHHSERDVEYIKNVETVVGYLISSISASNGHGRNEKVFAAAKEALPLAETAYEQAKALSDMRANKMQKHINRIRNTGIGFSVAGFFMFIGFSIAALKRVSSLEVETKERANTLRDWVAQWERTFNSIQDSIFIMDDGCRISAMNKNAKVSFADASLGKLIQDSMEGDFMIACKSVCKAGLRKEIAINSKTFTLRSFPMLHDNVESGCVVVVKDITAEKETENRLAQSEKMASLGSIVASVAHELNNPLNAVSGYSQLLLNSASDENTKQMAQKIYNSSERAFAIVQDLLVFSKTPRLEMSEVSIKDVLDETIEMLKEAFEANDINVSMSIDGDDISVFLDKLRIERVLFNIISNAIQAVHNSGKGDRIDIKAYREDGKAVITISDNGPGIPDSVKEKIFEPFFTTKKFEEGTGLGLSICRNIVRAHGGDIKASGKEGQGAIFTVELPYQKL
jgi:nitrogen-specific signal transduction histidine kinase